MPKIIAVFSFLLLVSFLPAYAQQDALLLKIADMAEAAKGKVSISVLNIETGKSLNYYNDEPCVMQSVFKFPIALAILNKVDKGEISLKHKIHITPQEMTKDTWSPMRDSFPNGNVNITFEDLLKYMVSNSDNIACDVLLRYLGGAKKVERYIHKLGIEDFAMKYDEAGMQKAWKNQYKNWCSAKAMTMVLEKFYRGKILSRISTDFLYQIMVETTTGKNRMVRLLPKGTIVAHKTGSSATNEKGLTAATNDVGIITLPKGQHLILSIFVCDAYTDTATIESVIASVAKVIYDDAINQ